MVDDDDDDDKDKGIESSNSSNSNNGTGSHGGKTSGNADRNDRVRTQRNHTYSDSNSDSKRTPNRENYGDDTHRRYKRDDMDDDDRLFRTTDGNNRDDRYNDSSSSRRGAALSRYHRDNGDEDTDRYRNRRERSDSGYFSDENNDNDSRRRDSRRDSSRCYEERSRRESSSNRSDRRRRHSKDYYYTSSEDDHDDDHNDDGDHEENNTTEKEVRNNEPKEWPPSFQENGSAFAFDVRSAMFYEPLSDFFYDPKSKLYYGNKKCAYFRHDENKEPPFVEVQKMTTEQVEEQSSGGIAQEKVAPLHASKSKAAVALSKPKIAIKFKTKKVKSSVSTSTTAAREAAATATISKAKQQQIANIGKWNEKQAELKQSAVPNPAATVRLDASPLGQGSSQKLSISTPPKIKTTAKGEPICLLCKKKFPNLAKLRLHEKGSELHKKNLLKLQENKKKKLADAAGTKRKLGETATSTPALDPSDANNNSNKGLETSTATTTATVYTDRAEKRRQLHGADLGGPQSLLRFEPMIPATPSDPTPPRTDLLDDETNVGHQMLQKMGYKADQQQPNSNGKPPTSSNTNTNEHLRKEWDRIEAMAQKSVPRYR
jgi:hypothetical protein